MDILDSLLAVEVFELIVLFGILIILAVRADRKGRKEGTHDPDHDHS